MVRCAVSQCTGVGLFRIDNTIGDCAVRCLCGRVAWFGEFDYGARRVSDLPANPATALEPTATLSDGSYTAAARVVLRHYSVTAGS